ncbi:MAG: hypothetical protein ACREA0_18380, partial [bacterium]
MTWIVAGNFLEFFQRSRLLLQELHQELFVVLQQLHFIAEVPGRYLEEAVALLHPLLEKSAAVFDKGIDNGPVLGILAEDHPQKLDQTLDVVPAVAFPEYTMVKG